MVLRLEAGLWSAAKHPPLSVITLLGTNGARWRLGHEQFFPGKEGRQSNRSKALHTV